MLTLLGSFLGFLTSLAPEILKYFQDARDKQHELTVMEMQMRMALEGHRHKLEDISIQADIAESGALNERVTPIGIRWIDALRGSVRPVITYLFFLLYAGVKLATIEQLGLEALIDRPWLFWTAEDQAIFAAIISFWFGARHVRKYRGE